MIRHLRAECVAVLRIFIRQPGFWIPTVLFPAMLYAFFGTQAGKGDWADNAMASFCIYAVVGVGFFLFGVSIAQDRESDFAKWQRSLPGSVVPEWIARIFACLFFVLIAVLFVIVLAFILADIDVDTRGWLRLAVVCFVSTITATFMGIALGSLVSARAAVPLANLIYLPLSYIGGLWVPPMLMPDLVDALSRWTPTRAMGELSWAAVDGRSWDEQYLLSLLAWTVAAAALTAYATRRTASAST